MEVSVKTNWSWIVKAIFKQRQRVINNQYYGTMLNQYYVSTRQIYKAIRTDSMQVCQRKIWMDKPASLRVLFMLWMDCNGRLATKDKLHHFGMIDQVNCCFCNSGESIQHLLFHCSVMKSIWSYVLKWLNVSHIPLGWNKELQWVITQC